MCICDCIIQCGPPFGWPTRSCWCRGLPPPKECTVDPAFKTVHATSSQALILLFVVLLIIMLIHSLSFMNHYGESLLSSTSASFSNSHQHYDQQHQLIINNNDSLCIFMHYHYYCYCNFWYLVPSHPGAAWNYGLSTRCTPRMVRGLCRASWNQLTPPGINDLWIFEGKQGLILDWWCSHN